MRVGYEYAGFWQTKDWTSIPILKKPSLLVRVLMRCSGIRWVDGRYQDEP